MPLDPSIALGVKPPTFNSPFENLGQILKLRNLQQEGQFNDARLQNEQEIIRKNADANALAQRSEQALKIADASRQQFSLPDGTTDQAKLRDFMVQHGLGAEYGKVAGNYEALDTIVRKQADQRKDDVASVFAAAHGAPIDHRVTIVGNGLRALGFETPQIAPILGHIADPQSSDQNIQEGIQQSPRVWDTFTKRQQVAGQTVKDLAEADKARSPKEPIPKGLQSENFLLDGKPVKGTFNPTDGTYAFQGQDVTSRVKPVPPASTTVNLGAANDVKDTITGMMDGTLPPQLPGRATKEYLALLAEAQRRGFNLAGAATDWQATQKHVATLNGNQQTRLRQAISTASQSLDVIDDLAKQWDAGKYPVLNNVTLKLAKNGALGQKAASIATQLDGQITDVTSELGNVYMGGNSPTDQALALAKKNLSANWSKDVLLKMTDLARQNLKIRDNSMKNVGVAGASDQNPYAPNVPRETPAPVTSGVAGPSYADYLKSKGGK